MLTYLVKRKYKTYFNKFTLRILPLYSCKVIGVFGRSGLSDNMYINYMANVIVYYTSFFVGTFLGISKSDETGCLNFSEIIRSLVCA